MRASPPGVRLAGVLSGPATAGSLAVCVAVMATGCGKGDPTARRPIEVITQVGEVGISKGQFSYPRCIDSDGDAIWVIDKAARVQRLDPSTGAYLGGWRMPDWKLGKPTGITIAPGSGGEPLVYVADTHYHRVLIYRPGNASEGADPPELVGQFGTFGEGPGEMVYPTDIAVLMEGDGSRPKRLYVGEYGGNDRVTVWEPGEAPNSFRFAFAFGRFGSGTEESTPEFSRPQSLAIDRVRNELVLTDACNHRVGRFTLDGELVAWFGSPDTADDLPGHFKYPYGLCLLGDGSAMIAEFGNNRVQRIDLATGASLGCYGTPGRGEGELVTPWGVAAVGDKIYVLDSGNNRVLAFARPRALAGGG